MQHIPQNVYYHGKVVVSVGCKVPDGRDATIGYIPNSGDYDFGIANRRETIIVTSGSMYVNSVHSSEDQILVVEKGEPISLTTVGPVTYLCIYD